jgi:uncharacterized membrane protein
MASAITTVRQRIESIDVLRGIVMVIMAIDHARDFFYMSPASAANVAADPTNLASTSTLLFFTRWITHFCAPTFLFLSGISAFLMRGKKTVPELRSFLLKRGLWLIIVEVAIITLAWSFNPFYNVFFLQVIWAIGISMVLLGLVVSLPVSVIMAMGAILLLGHNVLDFEAIVQPPKGNFLWDLALHGAFNYYPLSASRGLIVVYAFLPWTGLMFLGYGFGRLYLPGFNAAQRRKILIRAGIGITVLFILLRFANVYGDSSPWAVQERGAWFTFLSFINTTKYPASLQYVSMIIGPSLIALALLEGYRNRVTDFFNQFGRVPMFFYIAHLYLLHAMLVVMFFVKGFGPGQITTPGLPFNFLPAGLGFGLPGVYIAWALAIAMLYPLCRRYNAYKSTHSHWWLSYF